MQTYLVGISQSINSKKFYLQTKLIKMLTWPRNENNSNIKAKTKPRVSNQRIVLRYNTEKPVQL